MFIANNLVFNGTGTLAMSAPTDEACSDILSRFSGGGITIVRLVA
jgi:hypothetical protein